MTQMLIKCQFLKKPDVEKAHLNTLLDKMITTTLEQYV